MTVDMRVNDLLARQRRQNDLKTHFSFLRFRVGQTRFDLPQKRMKKEEKKAEKAVKKEERKRKRKRSVPTAPLRHAELRLRRRATLLHTST